MFSYLVSKRMIKQIKTREHFPFHIIQRVKGYWISMNYEASPPFQ